MKQIDFIFGAADFAAILYSKLRRDGIAVEAFVVDQDYICTDRYLDRPLLVYEELRQRYPGYDIGIYVGTIARANMFEKRVELFARLQRDGYRLPNYISPRACIFTPNIGAGNVFMENVVIEEHCTVGNGNIFWPNVVLPHHNEVGDYNNLSPSVSFSGYAAIGSRCFIGNNAALNNHAVVHDRALIGAGAFVRHTVQEEEVLVPGKSEVLKGHSACEFR